ncbi:GNAT family N-acetyltransferase [Nocardioides lianchengensis]|uniref:Protein N-acetyltransferase, RimJ/RimL family n=1 Tax=Nocardioides lianchengensis TaxID=1045774 RepID=A0A1G6SEB5_9ACTN|nr:GNAT family protein [Nocardioides lianchengensis]NYG09806.1 RimJ/RimL family protein N-acetyltransferase [Nocardioides lianchengensis]SDD15011.1 Protein N-acetyltransferase, RimJ/RimL family [Nocardioides lianchengensis]
MLAHSLGADAELRPLEPWQAPTFAAYVERHRAHLAPWLPWGVSITDEDAARAFLQRYADGTAADGGRIYGLWAHGELVGGTLFRIFDARASLCEVGVWLAPGSEGRGLITRAVTAMVDWAVRERGIRRVEWHCVPENTRSRAVAVRLGMTHEGTLRQDFEHAGRRWDTEVWAVLAEEWVTMHP